MFRDKTGKNHVFPKKSVASNIYIRLFCDKLFPDDDDDIPEMQPGALSSNLVYI